MFIKRHAVLRRGEGNEPVMKLLERRSNVPLGDGSFRQMIRPRPPRDIRVTCTEREREPEQRAANHLEDHIVFA